MDLASLFYPKSIAVVGASPAKVPGKPNYYLILKESGYKGKLYPVNPAYTVIEGTRSYPSLDALPESVDLVIVSVPVGAAMKTLEAAAKKRVKFVHFFTSGFSETGRHDLEEEMLRVARKDGTRIVGPNCLGIHCTESRVTFNPLFRQANSGNVAFLSQSGGLSDSFLRAARSRQIEVNKAVSFGNQLDLKIEDYLDYLFHDSTVEAIGAYIEDIKNGRAFLSVLKQGAVRKPLVILKGGMTEQGARAAASHTGAMALQHHIWSSAVRQYGCLEVDSFEKLLDVIMLATAKKIPAGPRVAFLCAGGGISVLFSDVAARHGLVLPELDQEVQKRIRERISKVNTSVTNPVDLGAEGFDPNIMAYTMEMVDNDPNIDAIVPYFIVDLMSRFGRDRIESGPKRIIQTAGKLRKPVIPVISKFNEDDLRLEEARLKIFSTFREDGLPVFGHVQKAAYAIQKILWWKGRHRVLE